MHSKNFVVIAAFGAALISLTLASLSFAQGADLFIGSWTLNRDKSKFDGYPTLVSETWLVTSEKNGLVRMVIDWVEADGTRGHVDYLTAYDGKVRPVAGNPDFDAVKYEQLGPRKFQSVLLKQNKVAERESYLISSDGNTCWDTDSGYDERGKPWTLHLVFERRH